MAIEQENKAIKKDNVDGFCQSTLFSRIAHSVVHANGLDGVRRGLHSAWSSWALTNGQDASRIWSNNRKDCKCGLCIVLLGLFTAQHHILPSFMTLESQVYGMELITNATLQIFELISQIITQVLTQVSNIRWHSSAFILSHPSLNGHAPRCLYRCRQNYGMACFILNCRVHTCA